jgi:peptidoglycan/LPS O-acetylase OafA/YrhL
VLAVVVYHAFPRFMKGGFTGVDIFFVISGYLISGIIFSQVEASRFSLLDFYCRRIRRIFPALLVVMAAVLGFGWYALLTDEYQLLGKHVAGGVGFIDNILFWRESGSFDIDSSLKPLLHLWSLGIEEQFYIILPALVLCLYRQGFRFST